MNKIVICGNTRMIKQIEDILVQCFKEEGTSIEIYHVSSPLYLMRDYLSDTSYKLIIINSKDSITYMINAYANFNLGISRYIAGQIKFPLTHEKIHKNIVEKLKFSWTCPYGSYTLRNKGVLRRILHEEIEYIHREKKKSIIYLNNGDSEPVKKSTAKIEGELNKSHFIKCSKGYIVNLFNIDKIDISSKTVRMKSGAEVPISRRGQREFIKALFITVTGKSVTSDK